MKNRLKLIKENLYYFFLNMKNKPKFFKTNFFKSLYIRLKGYTADQYHLYNFKENNKKEYITERERYRTRKVNNKYNVLFDDKLIFDQIFKNIIEIPNTYFYVRKGKLYSLKDNNLENMEYLMSLLKKTPLIIKRNYGGGGFGLYKVELIEERLYVNNDTSSKEDLKKLIKTLNNYIIQEFVFQHEYSKNINPMSANTIRILTYINELGELVLSHPLHRFGSKDSGVVDNISSGGYFTNINLNTGEMGCLRSYRSLDVYDNHPDSNKKVKGILIPKWELIKSSINEAASKVPFLEFIAWDIIVTDDGFKVVEVNASTGLTMYQMIQPLRYTELGNYFRYKGVIK